MNPFCGTGEVADNRRAALSRAQPVESAREGGSPEHAGGGVMGRFVVSFAVCRVCLFVCLRDGRFVVVVTVVIYASVV